MRIDRISSTFDNRKSQNYNFRAWDRIVVPENTKILWAERPINANSTSFYRLEWTKNITEVIEKFKNCNKVNVHNYGCSDGSEALSLEMLLLNIQMPKKLC